MIRAYRDLPLRRKIVLSFLLLAGTLGVSSACVMVIREARQRPAEASRRYRILAELLAYHASAALAFDDPQAARDTLAAVAADPAVAAGSLYRADGSPLARFRPPELGEEPAPDAGTIGFPALPSAGPPRFLVESSPLWKPELGTLDFFRNKRFQVMHWVRAGDQFVGAVSLTVDLADMHREFIAELGVSAIVLALLLSAAAAASRRLARGLSAPVLSLTRTMAAVAWEKDYSLREPRRSADEIGDLTDGFNRMLGEIERAEKALRRHGLEMEALLDSLPGQAYAKDRGGVYRAANRSFCEFLGRQRQEVIGKTAFELFSTDRAEKYRAEDEAAMSAGCEVNAGEERLTHGDREIYIATRKVPILELDGSVVGLIGLGFDVTEQKRTEENLREAGERLRLSLEEKQTLLREVHHRVKNNLQVISSLLYLQGEAIEDEGARKQLRESRDRVRTMALVHQKLYESKSLAAVSAPEYLGSVLDHVFQGCASAGGRVRRSVAVEEVLLSPDQAVACGLIVTELVANALEHAFPDGRSGEVRLALTRQGERTVVLEVTDDGVGLPPGFDSSCPRCFGLSLVRDLARQLGGTAEVRSRGGTRAAIEFPFTENVGFGSAEQDGGTG